MKSNNIYQSGKKAKRKRNKRSHKQLKALKKDLKAVYCNLRDIYEELVEEMPMAFEFQVGLHTNRIWAEIEALGSAIKKVAPDFMLEPISSTYGIEPISSFEDESAEEEE